MKSEVKMLYLKLNKWSGNSYINKRLIRHRKLTKLKKPMSAPSENYVSRKQLAVVRGNPLGEMPAR